MAPLGRVRNGYTFAARIDDLRRRGDAFGAFELGDHVGVGAPRHRWRVAGLGGYLDDRPPSWTSRLTNELEEPDGMQLARIRRLNLAIRRRLLDQERALEHVAPAHRPGLPGRSPAYANQAEERSVALAAVGEQQRLHLLDGCRRDRARAPSVMPGEHEHELTVDTGPWSDRREDRASSSSPPARSTSSRSIRATGSTSASSSTLRSRILRPSACGRLSPPGFTITKSSGKSPPRYEDGVWTWLPRKYKAGENIKLDYTVKVGYRVADGTYDITGLVRNDMTH